MSTTTAIPDKKDWTGKTKIEMVATDAHPHRKEGETFEVHPVHHAKLTATKWAVLPGEKTSVKGGAIPLTTDPALAEENDRLKAENESLKQAAGKK